MTVKIQLIVNYNTKITCCIRLAALITYSAHSAFVKSYPHLPLMSPFLAFVTQFVGHPRN